MKNKASLLSIILVSICFICFRFVHLPQNERNGYNAVSWDGLGYYMYLPSVFIYKDVKELKWIHGIDSTYGVTGGVFYQASKLESGTYTNKYLGGVAIIQAPYFFLGHLIASYTGTIQDGFSWPYQYALIFGLMIWGFIGIVFLRKILLYYFDDKTSAITLLLITLCSNLIQYITIDPVQSHCAIFTLYALLIWFTIKWHEKPQLKYAVFIGLTCGLAVISRPTELIIIFIPLLWQMNTKALMQQKWNLVATHRLHLLACFIGGLVGVLPQLLYWKYTTGSFIYDVGSKWFFLNPWFRVLFGPEKGWFLYTPIAIMMVWGLGLMKKYPFQKSVLTFCLLNIWIIIAWSDWRYGGSYSTRALVQSYPVFALSLASLVHIIVQKSKAYLLYGIGFLLLILNFYQLQIYNSGVGECFSPILKLFSY
jgi:hypothetical protein